MKSLIIFVCLASAFMLAHAHTSMEHTSEKATCDLWRGPVHLGKLFLSSNGVDHELKIGGELTLDEYEDGEYGFHIHQEGQLGNDCKDAKGHYNPHSMDHGAPSSSVRHVGDLGNIRVVNKKAMIRIIDNQACLSGEHSVMGRSIVLHRKKDDLGVNPDQGSKTTGNAGDRYSCCVITRDLSKN